jgi:hypothetical protein
VLKLWEFEKQPRQRNKGEYRYYPQIRYGPVARQSNTSFTKPFYRESQTMKGPPDGIAPGGAVPQTAQEHGTHEKKDCSDESELLNPARNSPDQPRPILHLDSSPRTQCFQGTGGRIAAWRAPGRVTHVGEAPVMHCSGASAKRLKVGSP